MKIDSGEMKITGDYDYPIQNTLKENYRFKITIKNDTVIAVQELPSDEKVKFEVATNEEDGDMFYNISFVRNGSYVFFVRRKNGRFYTYENFNKAYNKDYDGYKGHD